MLRKRKPPPEPVARMRRLIPWADMSDDVVIGLAAQSFNYADECDLGRGLWEVGENDQGTVMTGFVDRATVERDMESEIVEMVRAAKPWDVVLSFADRTVVFDARQLVRALASAS
jgi:hypothetical protein